DPAGGHRVLTPNEFAEGYSGVVLTFKKGPEFKKGGERPRFLSGFLARARGYRWGLFFGLLAALMLGLLGVVMPGFTTVFVDHVLLAGRFYWLLPLCGLLALVVLFQTAAVTVKTTAARRLRAALAAGLASRFVWHLLHLPMTFYLQRSPGEVSVRQSLTTQMADALTDTISHAASATFTLLLTSVLLLAISPLLAAIGFVVLLTQVWALLWAFRKQREPTLRASWDGGRAQAIGLAAVQGIETIKSSGMEAGVFEKWAAQYSKAAAAKQETELTGARLSAFIGFGESLLVVLVLAAGGLLVMNGSLTIGLLVTVQILAGKLLDPTEELSHVIETAREWSADTVRLDDVMDNPLDMGAAVALGPNDPHRLTGAIEARKLTFGFAPLDPPLLTDFELTVKPGEWVALVGASGSGKSTALRLLAGLYKPWSGEVRLDGKPRDEFPRVLVTSSVGYVDQDVVLFEGTVRENLTLWDPNIPDDRVWRACEDAAIAADVTAMPGGLGAMIRDGGTGVSGGQRQRLDLARALAAEPSVLLLDEPTSALDAVTEAAVFANLRKRGLTCVVAAHRLSTVRNCDQILVMEGGVVVERGTHDQLVARKGYYAHLLAEGDE
ncbi:MAG TPA: ATP-binding cassette domain-containing protein, partial [Gemmataceae bacterium]|nr:ATP-binding cassette domain-containing protein [Gemmataceae bacterium]